LKPVRFRSTSTRSPGARKSSSTAYGRPRRLPSVVTTWYVSGTPSFGLARARRRMRALEALSSLKS
jgi:hypothetical protein